MGYLGVIERYRRFLPVTKRTPVISLKEGNTPLILSKFLSTLVGKNTEVWLKYEGLNPTGSFKDRGMTVAVSKAREANSEAVICASTGNTSASSAAYAACAKIKCIVLIPKGAVALGKLAQALIHGAKVITIDGNFDVALKLVREISERFPIVLVNSLNPHRIEGQKTAAFEICDELDDSPDYHIIPIGNAGNITAYWKGYKEYYREGKIKRLPCMIGFQAEDAAPIVRGRVIKNPRTIATAIRIGNPVSWKWALEASKESGGLIDTVTDKEIVEAYKLLATQEGLFVEPASAATVAGILKLVKNGYFKRTTNNEQRTTKIVCILTGHGLKDPHRAIRSIQEPKVIPAKIKAVLREIGYA